MTSPYEDYALVMAAVTYVDAQLAKDLLGAAGIPVHFHGMDRDIGELGAAVHMQISRQDVLVPREAYEEALRILGDAWEDYAPPQGPRPG